MFLYFNFIYYSRIFKNTMLFIKLNKKINNKIILKNKR